MVTVKEKYGYLPTSVWHLDKKHPVNELFKDKGDALKSRRGAGSFLPNYKFSSFNPNIVERVLKYWTEEGDVVFDPFAGRTTRGIVSLYLNRKYIGCEIAPITYKETLKNLKKMNRFKNLSRNNKVLPGEEFTLLNEDGCVKHKKIKANSCDLAFTCPPYWKLERYEHVDGQLSDCKTYDDFLNKIGDSIQECNRVLKEDKFSVWVCSDWRNSGFFCFHQDLINLHLARGFVLWDIIINVLNSPFVAFKAAFNDKYKYTGKTHEYILVFKKKT